MDSRVLVPLLSPFTSYSEWQLNMISYLKRQGIYEISIGAGEESYEGPSDWLNEYDRAIGVICLAIHACATLLILLITQRISRQHWQQ